MSYAGNKPSHPQRNERFPNASFPPKGNTRDKPNAKKYRRPPERGVRWVIREQRRRDLNYHFVNLVRQFMPKDFDRLLALARASLDREMREQEEEMRRERAAKKAARPS